jgi:hypothetical protein
MAYNLFTCLSLLLIYHVHVTVQCNVLNMVYSVSNEIIAQKILNHKPCKFIILCLQSVMELGIPFAKAITH